jgi:hypothetical protein
LFTADFTRWLTVWVLVTVSAVAVTTWIVVFSAISKIGVAGTFRTLIEMFNPIIYFLVEMRAKTSSWEDAALLVFIFALLGFFLIIYIISYALHPALQKALNILTWRQIRHSVYGGSDAIYTGVSPHWSGVTSTSNLPKELAKELTDHSDKIARNALSELRKHLFELASSIGTGAAGSVLDRFVTWDELIHCSYFSVPRFRLLIVYAIAHSPGFRPSGAFRRHADFELVSRWYEVMKARGDRPQT